MIQISVVVPTYNRRDLLERCLRALLTQTLDPSEYEIIVADDEASLKTYELEAALRTQYPLHHIQYVSVTGSHGPAAARNQGWQKAKGKVVAFTDDDCIPHADWLLQGLMAINQGADAAWGKIIMSVGSNPTDYELSAAKLSIAEFVTANCFCLRSILQTVGGFDERFRKAWREDSDFYFTLLERNYRIAHAPLAVINHPIRPAPFGIALKQEKNNFYEALLFKKHPALYRSKIGRGVMPFYYVIVAVFVSFVFGSQISGAVLCVLLIILFLNRISKSSKNIRHIVEVAITSMLIPFLSVLWRIAGFFKFRTFFI
jgi:glycosyltransferase involved in cell wall biosynthesis